MSASERQWYARAAGYKLTLIMPANMSEERRAAMAAFGAQLISVPAGKMELARDLAHEMQVRQLLPHTVLAHFSTHWHSSSSQRRRQYATSLCMTARWSWPATWRSEGRCTEGRRLSAKLCAIFIAPLYTEMSCSAHIAGV